MLIAPMIVVAVLAALIIFTTFSALQHYDQKPGAIRSDLEQRLLIHLLNAAKREGMSKGEQRALSLPMSLLNRPYGTYGIYLTASCMTVLAPLVDAALRGEQTLADRWDVQNYGVSNAECRDALARFRERMVANSFWPDDDRPA